MYTYVIYVGGYEYTTDLEGVMHGGFVDLPRKNRQDSGEADKGLNRLELFSKRDGPLLGRQKQAIP